MAKTQGIPFVSTLISVKYQGYGSSDGGESEMWEEYLDQATSQIVNKYQARRLQARIRETLLDMREGLMDEGVLPESALALAMERLGDPRQLARQMAIPERHQHGWLWLLSVAQLALGLGLLLVSVKTESFASLALGRILALWGILSTGLYTRRGHGLKDNLRFLRWRIHAHSGPRLRVWGRVMLVGAIPGVVGAFIVGMPWNMVSTNVFHPVVVSSTLGIMLAVVAVWIPWVLLRRHVGSAFHLVTFQAWASLSATLAYTGLVLWHEGFTPPPLYNWQPELLMVGSWLFSFVALRALSFMTTLKERAFTGLDEDFMSMS